MEFLIKIIITPIVLLIAAKVMSGVYIKDTKSAIITSIAILVVGFLVGWLITLLLNILTLGLLWIVGLGIITRTIAYAIVIEIIDQVSKGFDTKGFMPSLWLSILLAISWGIVEWVF
ncbi:MAG: phage holin family protein [Cyclobacteriaceae bacterium]